MSIIRNNTDLLRLTLSSILKTTYSTNNNRSINNPIFTMNELFSLYSQNRLCNFQAKNLHVLMYSSYNTMRYIENIDPFFGEEPKFENDLNLIERFYTIFSKPDIEDTESISKLYLQHIMEFKNKTETERHYLPISKWNLNQNFNIAQMQTFSHVQQALTYDISNLDSS